MRFIARARPVVFLVSVGLVFWASSVLSDNVCNCESPPGGVVRCEEGQVAICRIKGGVVYAECKSPPSYATTGTALKSWLASDILKTKVKPEDVEKGELKDAFRKHEFQTTTGEVIKFSFPNKKDS